MNWTTVIEAAGFATVTVAGLAWVFGDSLIVRKLDKRYPGILICKAEMGFLNQKMDSVSKQLDRVEGSLDKLSEKVDEKFEKLSDRVWEERHDVPT